MNVIKKSVFWIFAAVFCLVFLIYTPALAEELKVELRQADGNRLSAYIRDNQDWDKLVSGQLLVLDAQSGEQLLQLPFKAESYSKEYSERFGDGWHYFETSYDSALLKDRQLTFVVKTAAGETRLAPSSADSRIYTDSKSAAGGSAQTTGSETAASGNKAAAVQAGDSAAASGNNTAAAQASDSAAASVTHKTGETAVPTPAQSGPGEALAQKAAAAAEAQKAAADPGILGYDGARYRKGALQGSFKLVGYSGDTITYSGTATVEGRTVAADPEVLPIGTKIIFNDHVYVVEDIGGAVRGKMIDIYFDNYEDANNVTRHGWTYADVYLAEPA